MTFDSFHDNVRIFMYWDFEQNVGIILFFSVSMLIDAIVDLLTQEEEEDLTPSGRLELRQKWQAIRMANMKILQEGQGGDEIDGNFKLQE